MNYLNIIGLSLNVVGTLLVFIDSYRKAVRISAEDKMSVSIEIGDGPTLRGRYLGLVGIGLVFIGFVAQLVATI